MAITIDTLASTTFGYQYTDLKNKITTVRGLIDSTACDYAAILDDFEAKLDSYYNDLAGFVGNTLDFLQDTTNCVMSALGSESSDAFSSLKENLTQSIDNITKGVTTSDFYQEASSALDTIINSADPCTAINDYLSSVVTNLETLISSLASKLSALGSANSLKSSVLDTMRKVLGVVKCAGDLATDDRFRSVLQVVDPQLDSVISSTVSNLESMTPESAVFSAIQAQLDVPSQVTNLAEELLL